MIQQTTKSQPTEEDKILEVTGLKKHFETSDSFVERLTGRGDTVKAVDGVDFTIEEGETLAIVGESGCGKTTLGQTVLKLEEPTEGRIRVQGDDIAGYSDRKMRPYRRELQMIFQDPMGALNPRKKIGTILRTPLEVHDIGDSTEERNEMVRSMLEKVRLNPSHFDRYPHQFSGGQQQRIGIARALMLNPSLIVADEPTSALDVSVQAQVINLLEDLQQELNLAMLLITHDLSVVRYIADRVAVMYLGEIVEIGSTEQLFRSPQHPYTKALLSAVPRINKIHRENRIILSGDVPSPIEPPAGCRFHTRCPEVIPPSDWGGAQPTFRAALSFRKKIEREGLNVEDYEESRSDSVLVEAILQETYPGDPTELPNSREEMLRSAVVHLIDGETNAGIAELKEAFPTPCEQQPETVSLDGNRTVSCHRLDSSHWADPIGDSSEQG
jgi:peptide/nickel transport system ATP-binding protein